MSAAAFPGFSLSRPCEDMKEIRTLLESLEKDVRADRVLLMPEGRTMR